ncbi:MAG: Uma2 family endonuclease [Gemmataceae bacterium]|nr:Uma2 family endonuclease [Gemmataceae bacterium]
MATVQAPVAEQRVVLNNVSWQTYEALLRELDRTGVRLTYDNGVLEIMTLSFPHERYVKRFARLIEFLAFELNISLEPGRSTTFRKEAEKRGLEPDECYWIQNEPRMRNKADFDPLTDPPPDLAVEVELLPAALNRMMIYASLGVPEVWRFDGEALGVYRLGSGGQYEPADRSAAFPFLPLEEVARFLQASHPEGETGLLRSFTLWVRKHLLPSRKQAKKPSRAQGKRKGPRKPK